MPPPPSATTENKFRHWGGRMKKYHQCLLLVFSVVSILCFVFYKHEYDRLRKVLEVLDIFGSPMEDGKLPSSPLLPGGCPNGSVEYIPDFWRQYSEIDMQLYAAFQDSNEKGWSISSLAVVSKDASSAMKRAGCALISGETADDKFEGTLEWKKIGNDSNSSAYSVICNVPEMTGIGSHLFSLFDTKSAVQLSFPIHLNGNAEKVVDSNPAASSLCVISDEPYWHADQVVDFVAYYAAMGVDNLFFYHRGFGDGAIAALKVAVAAIGNVKVHLAPWNRPTSSLDIPLVHSDCARRHSPGTGPVAVIQMGRFLVAPKSYSLATFLAKAALLGSSEHVHEARIVVQSLCSNLPNAEASPLKLTRFMKNPAKKEMPRSVLWWTQGSAIPGSLGMAKTSKIDPSSAKILVFEPCPVVGTLEKSDEDPAIRRFVSFVQKIPHRDIVHG